MSTATAKAPRTTYRGPEGAKPAPTQGNLDTARFLRPPWTVETWDDFGRVDPPLPPRLQLPKVLAEVGLGELDLDVIFESYVCELVPGLGRCPAAHQPAAHLLEDIMARLADLELCETETERAGLDEVDEQDEAEAAAQLDAESSAYADADEREHARVRDAADKLTEAGLYPLMQRKMNEAEQRLRAARHAPDKATTLATTPAPRRRTCSRTRSSRGAAPGRRQGSRRGSDDSDLADEPDGVTLAGVAS